jgi:hypothetical protein
MTRVATVSDNGDRSVHVSFPEGFSTNSGTGHHLILRARTTTGRNPGGNHAAILKNKRRYVTIRFTDLQTCGTVRVLIKIRPNSTEPSAAGSNQFPAG